MTVAPTTLWSGRLACWLCGWGCEMTTFIEAHDGSPCSLWCSRCRSMSLEPVEDDGDDDEDDTNE